MFGGNNNITNNKQIDTRKKPYSCFQCEKYFPIEKSFEIESHLREHRLESKKNKNRCMECGRKFSNLVYLEMHTFMFHTARGQQQLDMDLANKIGAMNRVKMLNVTPANDQQSSGQELEANSSQGNDDKTMLECLLCGDKCGFKSESLLDRFQPQKMGMRFICPECAVSVESSQDLAEYFDKAAVIMENW